MFHDIPQATLERMRYLETLDSRDRINNTPHHRRLRQIPPETGKFLALLAAGTALPGKVIEIGTSAGYSSLWLLLACRSRGDRLTTFEVLPGKIKLAQESFHLTGNEQNVELIAGDARKSLAGYERVAFCFLDAEKDYYQACYDLVVPNLVPGGIFAADNVISHHEALRPFVDYALADMRVDGLVVPVGKGVLVCRKA